MCIDVAWCKATPLEYFMKCVALNQNFGASWVDTLCDVELTVMCLTDFLGTETFFGKIFFPLSTNGAQKWKAGLSLFRSVVNLLEQSDDAFSCHLSLIGRALKDSSNSPDPSALLLRCVLESNSKQQNWVNKSLWVMQRRTYSFFLVTQSSVFCVMLVLCHLIYGINFLGTW